MKNNTMIQIQQYKIYNKVYWFNNNKFNNNWR